MKVQEFINKLRAEGRYSFALEEIQTSSRLAKISIPNALHRLKGNECIVSPAKGFYLILPPGYRVYGCLPADMFIPDLMKHINQPYYVGFLSAAQFYGAAHQKPQRFQVVTSRNLRPIHCGRIYVEFITNKNVAQMPTKLFNTQSGQIVVATPEVIAADLVSSPKYGAGINNVATVLSELVESMDAEKLIELTKIRQELFWVQRLGYLLEFLGCNNLADGLAGVLKDKKLYWIKLVSRAPYKTLSRDKKWKIVINTTVEPDE